MTNTILIVLMMLALSFPGCSGAKNNLQKRDGDIQKHTNATLPKYEAITVKAPATVQQANDELQKIEQKTKQTDDWLKKIEEEK